MDWSAAFWLVCIVVFLIMESSTVALVSIRFAAGAFAALVASLCGAVFWLEMVLFIGIAVLALAALRPMLKKFITPKMVKTNVDAIVGQQGKVIADIDNLQSQGTIKLGAMEWSARSTDGSVIQAGAVVQVDKIEGVKAFVSAVK